MRRFIYAIVVLTLFFTTGCISLRIGTSPGRPGAQVSGLVNGYATLDGLHRYNGTIFQFGLFDMSERPGEILSADLWPIAGFGVGLVGARIRILMLDMGLGVLWYDPTPPPPPPPSVRVDTVAAITAPDAASQ